MKKIILVAVLGFTFFITNAQEQQNDTVVDVYKNFNELKLNGVMLLVGAIEVSYERNLTKESSVGISFFAPYDDENLDTNLNYYISPYYRIFFGKKYAAGFFIEGFAMINSTDRDQLSFNSIGNVIVTEETVTDVALGFSLGSKWVTEGGFVFELVGGIGRNLLQNNNDFNNDVTIVGKFGFNLGYRF